MVLRVLLIDDNPHDRLLAIRSLEREFDEVQIEQIIQAEDFALALSRGQFNIAIADYQLRWSDGLTVLQAIKARYPDRPAIMFTSSGTQEIAVEAMKSGLDDYVIKSPTHYVRLGSSVRLALERTEAKRKAQGLEVRLQTLLNQLNLGIYRLGADGILLEGNAAFLQLLGLRLLTQIPTNQTLEAYFQPEDYAQLLSQLKQNGEIRDRELQLQRADGSAIWVRVSQTFSSINGGAIIDGLMEDISDRKRAEEEREQLLARERIARAEAEADKQRSLFLAEASRLLASSLDYRTTLNNVARLAIPTLADWCAIDIIENPLSVFNKPVVAASNPEIEAQLLELRQRYPLPIDANYKVPKVENFGKPELVEEVSDSWLQSIARDAEHLKLLRQFNIKSYVVAPLIFRSRKLGTIAFVWAQSGRRYTRADLEMVEELAYRAGISIENAKLYQEAQEANQLKDQFLAIVSHELRTPLNSIMGWVQMLRKRQMNEATITKALEIIERNAKLQAKLIEDILDISRIVQNKIHLDVQLVHLVPVVNAALEDVKAMAKAKSIAIESIFEPSVGQVMGDPERLQQVVWNLISNAVKFTPAGGQVKIELDRVNAFAQIKVTDTGIGIGVEFLPYVFDRFRQADSTITRTKGGLGLGLAIVRQLVEMHNGNVWATSQGEGKGATFIVQLPIQDPQPVQLSEDSKIDANDISTLNGLRILVVDDDSDTRELLGFILSDYQAQVTTVASVTEALQVFSQSKFDILISDISMPDEDGYSLIRQVRSLPADRGGQLPAIALTAFAREEDRQQAIEAGFQKHVAKPVNLKQLLAAIATLVDERSP